MVRRDMPEHNHPRTNGDRDIVPNPHTLKGRWTAAKARKLLTPEVKRRFNEEVARRRALRKLPSDGSQTGSDLEAVLEALQFPRLFRRGNPSTTSLVRAFDGDLERFMRASEPRLENIPRVGPVRAKMLYRLICYCDGRPLKMAEPKTHPSERELPVMIRNIRAFTKGLLRSHHILEGDGKAVTTLLRRAAERPDGFRPPAGQVKTNPSRPV